MLEIFENLTQPQINDLINGGFEFLGSVASLNNCRILLKDKKVMGSSIYSMLFITTWCYYNLYFYPSIGQTYSFYGAVIMVIANSLWSILAIYYSKKANVKL